MHINLEKVTRESFAEFDGVRAAAFGQPNRGAVRPGRTVELDRMWIARDTAGDAIGCVGGMSVRVTLASGLSSSAVGVRWLGTHPQFRGRGVMRALLNELETDAKRRGDALSLAWAIAPSPYVALGYAQSGHHLSYAVRAVRPRRLASTRCRPVTGSEAATLTRDLYQSGLQSRPGAVTRTDEWWAHTLAEPIQIIALFDGDDARAYALCHPAVDGGSHHLDIVELVGPAAYAAELLEFLSSMTDGGVVRLHRRPTDDPLVRMSDRFEMQDLHRTYGMHARILNPQSFFAQLGWSGPDLPMATTDRRRTAAEESFVVTTDGVRTGGVASLTVDLASLSTTVFGAAALCELDDLTERVPGALAVLNDGIRSEQSCWQSTWF